MCGQAIDRETLHDDVHAAVDDGHVFAGRRRERFDSSAPCLRHAEESACCGNWMRGGAVGGGAGTVCSGVNGDGGSWAVLTAVVDGRQACDRWARRRLGVEADCKLQIAKCKLQIAKWHAVSRDAKARRSSARVQQRTPRAQRLRTARRRLGVEIRLYDEIRPASLPWKSAHAMRRAIVGRSSTLDTSKAVPTITKRPRRKMRRIIRAVAR